VDTSSLRHLYMSMVRRNGLFHSGKMVIGSNEFFETTILFKRHHNVRFKCRKWLMTSAMTSRADVTEVLKISSCPDELLLRRHSESVSRIGWC
jgi:hypothetical protein